MSFSASSLSCIRGDRPVFIDVNFKIGDESTLVVTGRNGAGKSSLLRLLCAFERPVRGEIRWDETPVFEDPQAFRENLHYVSHKNPLKDSLKVVEHLRFWARFGRTTLWTPAVNPPAQSPGGSTWKSSVDAAMDAFQLEALADAPVRLLSQGQRRRLTLARLLCQDRRLWLLDEPSVGLDQASLAKLEILIEDHRRNGGVAVVVTHTRLTLLKSQKLNLDDHAPGHASGHASGDHDLPEFGTKPGTISGTNPNGAAP